MDMSEVKAFNSELSGLYENKPPISKAKMSAITKGAIKAIKFYKHVVHSVEKFIQKCKPEYKVPGLYVIDSIVRQSRHQFGQDKDVFAPRFAKNMQQTFANLFRCPPEDKRNIIRVLNLWQKNHVFSADVIQPLMDMADPNHPLHQEIQAQQNASANGSSLNASSLMDNRISPAPQTLHTPHNSTPLVEQEQSSAVKFNRKLLNDFEYESEDDSHEPLPQQPAAPGMPALSSILTNPEIMRQLQSLQAQMQMMTGVPIPLMPMVSDMQNTNLPFLNSQQDHQKPIEHRDDLANESDIEFVDSGPQVIEIPDANDSRSPSPSKSRRHRSRSPKSRSRRRSRSRSRSPRKDRRRERDRDREKDREKTYKEREAEKEKLREREKKGLPPIKKDNLSVCSTTLWVGHLSKLATPEELSDLFGEVGGVVSIDVVAPRGCAFVVMERRRDAAKALSKLNKFKLHSKEITVAWAPGKGVKGREWKDYWEAEVGASYLPWGRLQQLWQLAALSLDALEDGGVVDEDTLPPWLPPRMMPKPPMMEAMTMLPPPGMPPCLPPNAAVVAAPSPLAIPVPSMPPPGMPGAMGPIPGGVPGMRPSLSATVPGMRPDGGLTGGPALLGFPPNMQPQPGGMVGGFLQGLVGLGGLMHPALHMHPPHHPAPAPTPQPSLINRMPTDAVTRTDDAMDLDTEENQANDLPNNDGKPVITGNTLSLPEQLQAFLSQPPPNFNSSEPPPNFNKTEPPFSNQASTEDHHPNSNDDKSTNERDRDRNRRDRERDRGRDRDRDRGRDRDRDRRERGGRDRDRDRDDKKDRDKDRERGRDRRDNRERDRDRDRGDRDRFSSRDNVERSRERSPRSQTGSEQNSEKSLQERLWEMANGKPNSNILSDEKRQDEGNQRSEQSFNEIPQRMEEQAPPRLDEAHPMDRMPPRHDHPPPLLDTPGGGVGGEVDAEGGWTQLPVSRPPPHIAAPTFRAELRMRGPIRAPLRGPWIEGPFGPRFNGMPPFNGPMFDGPPRLPPFARMPFDGLRPPFDISRLPFDGSRLPFNGPRPPFDGSMPPFDGPRLPFDGSIPPFDGQRPFDGPPSFEGPPPFDGTPQFDDSQQFDDGDRRYERNNRQFDERDSSNERGWNGDRDNNRGEWDRRNNEWDDHRRDRRRDHDDRSSRDNRRRNFDDRSRTNRDERSSNDENSQQEEKNIHGDLGQSDEHTIPEEKTSQEERLPREERPPRKERDRKSRWGNAEEISEDRTIDDKLQESVQISTIETISEQMSTFDSNNIPQEVTEDDFQQPIVTENESQQPIVAEKESQQPIVTENDSQQPIVTENVSAPSLEYDDDNNALQNITQHEMDDNQNDDNGPMLANENSTSAEMSNNEQETLQDDTSKEKAESQSYFDTSEFSIDARSNFQDSGGLYDGDEQLSKDGIDTAGFDAFLENKEGTPPPSIDDFTINTSQLEHSKSNDVFDNEMDTNIFIKEAEQQPLDNAEASQDSATPETTETSLDGV